MGKISIEIYDPNKQAAWDEFVAGSNNGTMFHKQAFLNYHNKGKFEFHHLMFYKNGKLTGVLPGGLHEKNKVYWSPTGASYGSIVTNDISFETALELVDALLDYSRERYDSIYMIPPPIIYNKIYNQHFEYAMLYRNFGFEYHYISHAIDLKKGNYFNNFDAKARREIRKIHREGKLRIEESKDYAAFYPILEENKAKFGVKPTHSLDDLMKLEELIPEDLKLFLVYKDDKPISGTLLFLPNTKVSLCFYVMMHYEYKHLRPVFLCFDEMTRWAQDNGYEWLDIGVSQDTASDNPMTPAMSLIYFKERFFARGLLRTTFHYDFTKEK